MYEDGGTGEVEAVLEARRTAPRLGGWELKVRWAGGWTDSWVGERLLTSWGEAEGGADAEQLARGGWRGPSDGTLQISS